MGGGGAERQLAYLARELRNQGCGVNVALIANGPNFERLRASGADIHRLNARGNHDPRLFLQLRTLIRQLKPQLVHTWLTQMDVLGGLAAWQAGIPWVLAERSSMDAYPRTAKHRAREMLAAKAAAIVSNSEGGDHYWSKLLSPATPRWVIPNGLPLDEIDAVAPIDLRQYGLSERNRVVLYAGRFSAEKNALGFLEGFQELRGDVVAVLCGDGPELPQVENAARSLGERVRIVGYTPELWGWLKAADVVVSPSFFEGHPNVVTEAMACRSALVVSDIPAHRAMLDETTAELVKPADPASIANGIRAVLENPERAAQRAHRARSRVDRYDIEKTAPQFLSLYHQIMSTRTMPKAS